MSITVRQLVETPHLRMSVLAGESGLDRPLTWAHPCELPDPRGWLNGGELVLSVGMALSEDPAEQVAYLERLHAADASAVAFGDTAYAKALSDEARATADRLSLPVLWVAYEVPYIAVTRVVIEANQREETSRLQLLQRAYEAVREAAVAGSDPQDLVRTLGRLSGCRLHVLELPYGNAVLGEPGEPDAAVRDAVVAEAARRPNLPAVMRVGAGDPTALVLPVQASRVAVLLAVPRRGKPDVALLQHVATILAVELEKRFGERERQRRLGAEVLAKLIDQSLEAAAADRLLAQQELDREPRAIVAWHAPSDRDAALHHRLAARGVSHLLLRRDVSYALVPASGIDALADEVAGPIGVSAELARSTRASDAAREARLALEMARAEQRPRFTYGERAGVTPFLPASLSDAEAVVAGLLGPLIAYDAEHGTELLHSLRCFLEHNRSWQRTAERLHVHKQTLHYRMRRVEELTRRRLDVTSDVAALWYALEADALLRADAGRPPLERTGV
jgi:PucR family transcriptional regulator, purine catabolism regulatory protein